MSAADMNGLTCSRQRTPVLAKEICSVLGIPLGRTECRRFRTASLLQILENVRGADVFVIQPTCRRPTRT